MLAEELKHVVWRAEAEPLCAFPAFGTRHADAGPELAAQVESMQRLEIGALSLRTGLRLLLLLLGFVRRRKEGELVGGRLWGLELWVSSGAAGTGFGGAKVLIKRVGATKFDGLLWR